MCLFYYLKKTDTNSATPLYIDSQNGHKDVAQILLANGALPNIVRDNGIAPLHIACQLGRSGVV